MVPMCPLLLKEVPLVHWLVSNYLIASVCPVQRSGPREPVTSWVGYLGPCSVVIWM